MKASRQRNQEEREGVKEIEELGGGEGEEDDKEEQESDMKRKP